MGSEQNELQHCKAVIESKLGWGSSDGWQTADFENLAELIWDQTGVSLSMSTLRRIWGRTEYNHLPSSTTLNTLARFAGSADWRSFVKESRAIAAEQASGLAGWENRTTAAENMELPPPAVPQGNRQWKRLAWIATVCVGAVIAGLFSFDQSKQQLDKSNYSFESRPVTRGIPNSVIFTYDASASPTDSVFIQQSWDASKKVLVDKDQHKHTCVYYEPGIYQAKLSIGQQVVKQHKLLVSTDGWAGLIERSQMPVYLKKQEFISADQIGVLPAVIESKNITLQPEPPLIKYFNVGNFEPVALDNTSFSVEVKNGYSEGAAACQLTYISLLTDDNPIVLPLSAKGCVSDLNLMSVDQYLSGKKADLSALGVDFSHWVRVSCQAEGGKIRYHINGRQVFEFTLPNRPIQVLGVAFGFRGTGAVRKVRLQSGGHMYFSAL